MKVLGFLFAAPPGDDDLLNLVPIDGSEMEFVPIHKLPEQVAGTISEMADASGHTPLGVIVDLSGKEGP